MTEIQPYEFTAQEIDGTALREDFVQKFLYVEAMNEGIDPFDHTMEELIEKFDMALGEAKRRWPHLDTDAEWADMDHWLSERGYIEPKFRDE